MSRFLWFSVYFTIISNWRWYQVYFMYQVMMQAC